MQQRTFDHHRRVTYDCPDIVKLWICRILLGLDADRWAHKHLGRVHPTIFALELPSRSKAEPPDLQTFRSELLALLESLEIRSNDLPPTEPLHGNVARLGDLVGLSEVDRQLIQLAVLASHYPPLSRTLDILPSRASPASGFDVIACILGTDVTRVRLALSPNAPLQRSGLLGAAFSREVTAPGMLSLLSERFASEIYLQEAEPEFLLRERVIPAPSPSLSLDDYGHVQDTLDLIVPYLRRALVSGRTGVNILLYGAPGTGKTQLACALAQELHVPLYSIALEDSEGRSMKGVDRARAYQAAQMIFSQRRSCILFDEIEDVFGSSPLETMLSGSGSAMARESKGWINRTLEDNPVPAIWITNNVRAIDRAALRRFDFVLELPVPPLRQRRGIIESICGDLVPQPTVDRLARNERIAPAVIARAANVVHALGESDPSSTIPNAIEEIIANTLRAQGFERLTRSDPDRPQYDPTLVTADCDLDAVASGLSAASSGRLLLYGPPGTGKSAFGRWLADRLDKPLSAVRGSDLLSPFVGGTERLIAWAFESAQRDGAVLLIDEIDGFLRDRRSARRSWELTQVNELLTQLEAFEGIFVATTNLETELDAASLRRFDLKIRFGPMTADAAWRLLSMHVYDAGLELQLDETMAGVWLARLEGLTPGDFAAVARRARFAPLATLEAWVRALESEVEVRGAGSRPIGFVRKALPRN